MIDLNKSAESNFLNLLEKAENDVTSLRKSFRKKISFYERTSRGKQKLRTRSGKSFKHRLNMYIKMDKIAAKHCTGDSINNGR